MVAPITARDLQLASDSTRIPEIKVRDSNYSRNIAEIALEMLAASFSDFSEEELLAGFEEIRQSVFEEFYGPIGESS